MASTHVNRRGVDSLGLQALCQLQGFKRQFWELKRTHMDMVLFVQVGNFYNLWVRTPHPLFFHLRVTFPAET